MFLSVGSWRGPSPLATVAQTPDGSVVLNDEEGSLFVGLRSGECVKHFDSSAEWCVEDPTWRPCVAAVAMVCNDTGTHVALRYAASEREGAAAGDGVKYTTRVAVVRLKGSSAGDGGGAVTAQIIRIDGRAVAAHWCPSGGRRTTLAVVTLDWRVFVYDADETGTPLRVYVRQIQSPLPDCDLAASCVLGGGSAELLQLFAVDHGARAWTFDVAIPQSSGGGGAAMQEASWTQPDVRGAQQLGARPTSVARLACGEGGADGVSVVLVAYDTGGVDVIVGPVDEGSAAPPSFTAVEAFRMSSGSASGGVAAQIAPIARTESAGAAGGRLRIGGCAQTRDADSLVTWSSAAGVWVVRVPWPAVLSGVGAGQRADGAAPPRCRAFQVAEGPLRVGSVVAAIDLAVEEGIELLTLGAAQEDQRVRRVPHSAFCAPRAALDSGFSGSGGALLDSSREYDAYGRDTLTPRSEYDDGFDAQQPLETTIEKAHAMVREVKHAASEALQRAAVGGNPDLNWPTELDGVIDTQSDEARNAHARLVCEKLALRGRELADHVVDNPWQALKAKQAAVDRKRALVERKLATLSARSKGSEAQFEQLEEKRRDSRRTMALGRECEAQNGALAHELLARLRRCQRPLSAAERGLAAEILALERGVRKLERRAEDRCREQDYIDDKLRRAGRVATAVACSDSSSSSSSGASGGAAIALEQEEMDLEQIGTALADLREQWAGVVDT